VALGIAIVACSMAFLYWDVRHNNGAQGRFGDILSVPLFSRSRQEQSEMQNVDTGDGNDGSSDRHWMDTDKHPVSLRNYAE
jgi:hypothetical protein